MPKFRNATHEKLSVATERGWVDVAPDEILTVSDAFARDHYFQTGETGEQVIWEPVAEAKKAKPE